MRIRSRLVLGLCGLALSVPAPAPVAAAQDDEGQEAVASAPSAQPMPAPANSTASHHHKGLFGWRHCVECQRAYVKAHDGVDIPPPPGYPGAMGGTIVGGPMMVGNPGAAGYAVVGPGGALEAPGYAVVGEPMPPGSPAPIGVARATQLPSADARTAAMAARAGSRPYDPTVAQTALPPAQVALASPARDRPHVISHLFGLPRLGRHWEHRAERRRETHAAISYGDSNQKVTELPASIVYSKK
jgi:hypothetical protein